MTGTIQKLGRPVSGPEVDIGYIGNGYQRSCVYDAHAGTLIVYALGGWVGEWEGGTPYARISMADVNTGDVPGDVFATTDEFQPSKVYSDITGGDDYVLNVTPFVHTPAKFSLSLTARNGYVAHSMRQAQHIGASNRNFYDKAIGGTVPTSPLGGSAAYNGHMSLWFVAEASVAPNTPTGLSPSGVLTGTDLTPLLVSSFSDANEVLNNGVAYDYLNRYQIRVVRISDGVVMWNGTFAASTAERNAKATSREYAGSALAYNTSYRYEIRHEDRTGLWSAWKTSTFSVTSLSTVDKPTNPVGFETSTSNPGNITAVYRHNAGLNANAMQAQLLSSSGSVIATSAAVAQSVAPNGTLSMTWASTGFANKVQNGGDYQIRVLARDTNNLWSPAWSPAQSFSFNAPPGTPTSLAPTNNKASASRPLLTLQANDPDAEHPKPLPTVYAEILTNAGALIATRTMTWNATASRYEYQTTASDLASHAAYKWQAYSYDGFLYSGGAATAAAATRSGVATFVYAVVPEVTITGPSSPIATPSPVITWTSTNQTHYRVRLYKNPEGSLAYDSGTIAGAAQSHPLAPGNWLGGEKWNNTELFDAIVTVTDTTTLTGDSDWWTLELLYTPPDALDVTAYPAALTNTYGTNAILLELSQTTYASEVFEAYEIWRSELLTDGITERPNSTILLSEITAPTTTAFLDAEVTSKQLYRYDVYQRITEGNDSLRSAVTRVVASVEWDGVIIHIPDDPEALHVALRYAAFEGSWSPRVQYSQPMGTQSPMGQGGRVIFFGRGQSHDPSHQFSLVSDLYSTADEKREMFDQIYEAQGGDWDGRPHVVCWRDGRGGKYGRIYGAISDPVITHDERGGSYILDLFLLEGSLTLGEGDT